MRPVYENSTTLAAEDRLASKLSDQWSCKTTKLGRKYKVDYALSRGGVIYAWAELKKRNIADDAVKKIPHLSSALQDDCWTDIKTIL